MATEADIRGWTAASGRDWNQLCQAYISNLCDAFGSLAYYPPSAIDAYYASTIESYDAYSAPSGAFIWLDIGSAGHVQLRVDGNDVAHGSSRCDEFWGINAGQAQLATYVAQTGATPLGWSWDSAGSRITYTSEDEEMDYETFRNYLQRALQYDVRPNGVGPDWQHGPTVWERFNTIEQRVLDLESSPAPAAAADPDHGA